MENAPLDPASPESGSEKSTDKDKKEKSKKVGKRIIEAPERKALAPEREKPERSWPFEKTEDKKEEPKGSAKSDSAELDPLADESEPDASAQETLEAEPVPAAEAPTEEIGETEEPVVESQLVEVIREIESGRAPDSDTDPAAEHFLDLVESGVGSETAYEMTLEELGAEAGEIEGVEEEPAAEPEEEPTELVIDHSPEAPPDEEEPEPATPPAGTGGTGGTTPPPAPPTGGGGAGPGPGGPGGPIPPFGGPAGPGGPGGFNPNVAPAPTPVAAPNRQPHQPEYHQASPAAMALLGGVIGYLIGRRRGRIKTEKKLLPVQKKLEKQVENLQWQIQDKERKIRRVAAEKVRQEGPTVIEAIRQKKVEAPPLPAPEKVVVRQKAPEAHQLHGEAPKAPERLGKVVMAEALPAVRESAKAKEEKQASKVELPAGKRVETLNRAELLAISEKVEVGGSTLRQIYETHLIGERGLRRLVGEHLRGGDLEKALRREIVEREIDFERDPAMRDMAPTGDSTKTQDDGAPVGAAGAATLNKLIEKAAGKVDGTEEAAFFRARAEYEAAQHEQHHKQRRVIDISITAVIAVLLAIVVMLIVRNG